MSCVETAVRFGDLDALSGIHTIPTVVSAGGTGHKAKKHDTTRMCSHMPGEVPDQSHAWVVAN